MKRDIVNLEPGADHIKPLTPVNDDQRYIGVSVPRGGIERLTQGLGQYLDDIELPRMAHVVFWRSPVAHMRINSVNAEFARAMPGVLMVADGHDLAKVCKPWMATLSLQHHKHRLMHQKPMLHTIRDWHSRSARRVR